MIVWNWVYYIYDKADRLIFSQDGNRRQAGEWMFYIPDISGKECFSGVCRNTFDLFSDPLDSVVVKADWYSGSSYGDGPYQGYYLSGVSLVSPIVLTVNYYNNYSFLGRNGIPSETDERTCYDESAELDGFGKRYIESSQGLLTGTMIAELPNANEPFMTVDYRYNVFYYDNLERVIQTKSSSYWSDEKEYFTYNFEGQPIKKKHFHSPYRGNDQTELYFYTYDNEGRSRLTTYQLNGGENVTLANRHYDVLGRLVLDFRSGRSELHTGYGYNVSKK